METETGLKNPIEQAFQNHIDDLGTAPAWWKEFKCQSFEAYANSPMPSQRDEHWRFSDRSRLKSIERLFIRQLRFIKNFTGIYGMV